MKILKFLPIFVLIILPLYVFREMAFQNKIPLYTDPITQFYPFAAFTAEMFRHGTMPLWNPYTFCGVPFLANIQTAVFYPLNFLYLVLPLNAAFSLKIIFHFIIGGIFTHLYLRKIKISAFSSLIGAVIFSFCGSTITQIMLLPILQTAVLIPFLFYLWENVLEKHSLRNISFAAAGFAVMIFSGYSQIYHFAMIMLAFYTLSRLKTIRLKPEKQCAALVKLNDASSNIIMLILFALVLDRYSIFRTRIDPSSFLYLINLLTALVILKALFYIRRVKIDFKKLLLAALVTGVIAGAGFLLAAVQMLPSLEFAGHSTLSKYVNMESFAGLEDVKLFMHILFFISPLGIYVGMLPLASIVFFYLILLMSGDNSDKKFYFFTFLLMFFITALTIFKSPLWFGLFLEIPRASYFRVLYYLFPFVGFFLAVLTGVSIDGILEYYARRGYRLPNSRIFVFALNTVFLLIVLKQLVIRTPYAGLLKFVEPEKYMGENNSLAFLKKDSSMFRYFCNDIGNYSYIYEPRERMNLLIPNTGLYYSIFDAQGYDPFQLNGYSSFVKVFNSTKNFSYPNNDYYHFILLNPENDRTFLDLLNIKYVISSSRINGGKYRLIRDGKVKIYQYKDALPRAYFVTRYATTYSDQIATAWLSRGAINPRNAVIIKDIPSKRADIRYDMMINIISAGFNAGDCAYIYYMNNQVSMNGRGYNIVVINQFTGKTEKTAVFDTFGSRENSSRMADFIRKIPEGRIVALSVKDEAMQNLTQEAVNALKSVGSGIKTENTGFRWAHALIGAKGMKPGKAQEAFSSSKVILPSSLASPEMKNTTDKKANARIEFKKYSPNKIILSCASAAPGYLVLSEIYYPGWKVCVDGKKDCLLQANSIFRAVYLGPGRHEVTFSYMPMSFQIGLLVSAAALFALISIVFSKRAGNLILLENKKRDGMPAC